MKIRTIVVAAAPAALAAVLFAGPAFASTGPSSNGQAGHMTGNKAISYQDPYFGGVQCNEVQHPAFDNVTCKFVADPALGLTSNAQAFYVGETGTVGWNSDFGTNALQAHQVTGTLTFTITGDATTGQVTGYTAQATYGA